MARMGNNAAAAAFAAEQERIQAEQLAEQLRNPPKAGLTSASVTLSPEAQAEQIANWDQFQRDNSGSRSFGGLFSPVEKTFDTFAKLPGTPEALAKGIEGGISGDLSWNPYSKDGASVWDYGAGGTKLAEDDKTRALGRQVGTAVGGYFAGPALSGAMGGGMTGAAGSGAVLGGGRAALQPGATWESVLKGAALGGATGAAGYGIKSYLSTDGTIKTLPASLGDPLPTDFADIVNDQTPITDFPEVNGGVKLPSSVGDYLSNPGYYNSDSFVGPPEGGNPAMGPPEAGGGYPGNYDDFMGPPEAPINDPNEFMNPLPPKGDIPPGGLDTDLPPYDYTIPEIDPMPIPNVGPGFNYGKLATSVLKNLLTTGGGGGPGSGAGGSGGGAGPGASTMLRQYTPAPVTTTNPNAN